GIDGFAFAAESLVGRFKGSDKPGKIQKAIKYCFIWGIGIGLATSAAYAWGGRRILLFFTDQQAVLDAAMLVFGWTIAGPTVSSFSYIWDGIFIGATETPPMRNRSEEHTSELQSRFD